jgi:hypothetical protein
MTYSWSSDELVRWLCKAVCSPGRMAITITNHLAACCLSEMASCFINDLPSVFCWVITSHLVVVFWQPSGMASSFISQMAITNHLATVFWLLSGMASCFTSSPTRLFLDMTGGLVQNARPRRNTNGSLGEWFKPAVLKTAEDASPP